MKQPQIAADWFEYLEQLNPQRIELGLNRLREVAARLALTRVAPLLVTIAGTNGKGSSAAMLAAIYQAANYRVGLYTSPHLFRINERLRLNGAAVTDERLIAAFEMVEQARQTPTPVELTYFEFTSLAFFYILQGTPLDIAILEVGLGGRLDAVNLFDADVALITAIDLDHQAYLGDTRELIGAEKAGVMRAGQSVICADPNPPASIAQAAIQLGAKLFALGQDFGFDCDPASLQWRYHSIAGNKRSYPHPALRGSHQLVNACGVLAVLEQVPLPLTQHAIRLGLTSVDWPARLQVLPGSPQVILDVAHNPHGINALRNTLLQLPFAPQTHAICGFLADKDWQQCSAMLQDVIDVWHCVPLDNPRALAPDQLASWLVQLTPTPLVQQHDSVLGAYLSVKATLAANERLVVFGSFATVGPIWHDWQQQKSTNE